MERKQADVEYIKKTAEMECVSSKVVAEIGKYEIIRCECKKSRLLHRKNIWQSFRCI